MKATSTMMTILVVDILEDPGVESEDVARVSRGVDGGYCMTRVRGAVLFERGLLKVVVDIG